MRTGGSGCGGNDDDDDQVTSKLAAHSQEESARQEAHSSEIAPDVQSQVRMAADGDKQLQPEAAAAAAAAARLEQADDEKTPCDESTQRQTLRVSDVRKTSSVSFKDVCELFEIDLEASRQPARPAAIFSLRFYVMLLALVSPFVVTYSRTIINFAIIDMIEPELLQSASTTTTTTTMSSATNLTFERETSAVVSTLAAPPPTYFDLDNSCPVDEATRERLELDLASDQVRARAGPGEKFPWDTVRQGLLKAAYSIGHMLLQVVGGRLSEIHGSHRIMSASSALIGLCCLAAPLLASSHFYLLFADLLALGILGSFMTPALITLFTNWLTPSEKSFMLSLYLVSSRLGYALSSLLCGLLIQAQLSWRYLFYSAGWIALVFSLLFSICARSRPIEHPLIKRAELDYLATKNTLVRETLAEQRRQKPSAPALAMSKLTTEGTNETHKQNNAHEDLAISDEKPSKKRAAPWLAILTSGPVWAFIVTKFCVKLAGDTVQIELPSYLKRVLHLAPQKNGLLNALNYVIFCVSCLLVGALAKMANKRRPFGWSKTSVRKLFQCTASVGAACALLGLSLSICHEGATLACLMLMFFFTTFSTGGEAQIPLDISERYAGTIHAIGSSLAISGAIEPILVGFILRGHPADRERWAAVWLAASAVALMGGLVFMLLGDATIQPFDKVGQTSEGQDTQEGKLTGKVNETFLPDLECGQAAAALEVATPREVEAPFKESKEI